MGLVNCRLPVEVRDLNEISARIVKHRDGRSCRLRRLLGERHAVLLQPRVLLLDVSDEEISSGYSLPKDLLLIRLRGRVFVGLENQLQALWFFRGDDGEPFVFSRSELVFL